MCRAPPQIRDTIARLCAENSDRIPKFLLPVIRAQLATRGEIRRSAAVVASWARYAEGTDERGEPIEVVDRGADAGVGGAVEATESSCHRCRVSLAGAAAGSCGGAGERLREIRLPAATAASTAITAQ
jgi:mannitol-1-phosphate/altronate dehydrogenase